MAQNASSTIGVVTIGSTATMVQTRNVVVSFVWLSALSTLSKIVNLFHIDNVFLFTINL